MKNITLHFILLIIILGSCNDIGETEDKKEIYMNSNEELIIYNSPEHTHKLSIRMDTIDKKPVYMIEVSDSNKVILIDDNGIDVTYENDSIQKNYYFDENINLKYTKKYIKSYNGGYSINSLKNYDEEGNFNISEGRYVNIVIKDENELYVGENVLFEINFKDIDIHDYNRIIYRFSDNDNYDTIKLNKLQQINLIKKFEAKGEFIFSGNVEMFDTIMVNSKIMLEMKYIKFKKRIKVK